MEFSLTFDRHELFDEYTRRQFGAKMPNKKNPFGNEEIAAHFADFDLFKKVRLARHRIQRYNEVLTNT